MAERMLSLKEQNEIRLQELEKRAAEGVVFYGTDGVIIGADVQIGEGTVIYPNVIVKGETVIGKHCVLTSGTVIEDCTVGDGCVINATQCYQSVLEEDVKIGPFSHVRPGSRLCAHAKIGDFVEIKKSQIGDNTKVSHLTYIGDAKVGERVNFGCGTITVNYDGKHKYQTVIEDDAFIGCNTNLVAPVTVREQSFIAAGSTIHKEVPKHALAISRVRQENKEEWVLKRNEKRNGGNKNDNSR